VVYGMTIATVIGLFIIPVCYVFVQQFSERGKKKAETGQVEVAAATATPHGGAH